MTINIVKARIDIYVARYEEVCKEVLACADLSSKYWLMEVASGDEMPKGDKEKEIHSLGRLLEAKIEGLQQQILLGDEDLRHELPVLYRGRIAELLPNFIDSITGGDFKARDGSMKILEASLVQYTAANLISEIRSGLRHRYRFTYLLKKSFNQH